MTSGVRGVTRVGVGGGVWAELERRRVSGERWRVGVADREREKGRAAWRECAVGWSGGRKEGVCSNGTGWLGSALCIDGGAVAKCKGVEICKGVEADSHRSQ